ncbi:BF3164 family lipoprotein [Proteiniphilum acetatigenes]|uniref:BF3164 family lipoprotein n=1 Tax=Proteiniphilum acetatigenes TaxID=294710 RepID=UPI00037FA78D|nr:BF3164 family lipoprotein [Proteiniphilum acetatigenes]SFL51727.1 TolB-like 6-blade propeller-like [Porphyromonadaceae bacterium KH3CP3RA]
MNKIYILIFCYLATIFLSCSKSTDTEKYQSNRNNTTNVKDNIVEIVKDDVLIGSSSRLYLTDDYLIIIDIKSTDMLIHFFNRNNYQYLTSAIPRGQGPGEITVSGHIAVNKDKKEFYMSDHGKLKIFTYPIDSILYNPYYVPEVKKELNNIQFPSEYLYINDTLCYARIIEPTGNVGHNEAAGKWNMQTGEVVKMRYTHPKVRTKRIGIAVSMEHETFVECYANHDLMTIMDLDGNLKCNVYGSNWNDGKIIQIYHFNNVVFRGDKIIASYSGRDMHGNTLPDKLLVFNINGDYIKTLDIGYKIVDFCYDIQNDRLLFAFDDMIQFGYLALNESMLE